MHFSDVVGDWKSTYRPSRRLQFGRWPVQLLLQREKNRFIQQAQGLWHPGFCRGPQNVEERIPHNFDGQTLLQDCYLLEIWSGYWNADLRSTFLNILLFWIAHDCYTVFHLVGLSPGSKLTRAGAWSGPMVDMWASPTVGRRKRRRLGLGRGGSASNGAWKC